MKDLREKTIRGGFSKVCAQAGSFVLRLGSLIVLARLLEPKDFGLMGMVTAVIGVLSIFKDFGLSTITVQRTTITDEQLSTLFWINILVGGILGLLTLASAPLLASFYQEPRLAMLTAVLASGFVFNAAGVQHGALLERQMRFGALAIIELISQFAGFAVGIGLALFGYAYWALVGMALAVPAAYSICVWTNASWLPGRPRRRLGIRSMVRFGGTVTLNVFVAYITFNLDKALLGRVSGATALGLYGRAYQLINIPTESLNSAIGGVAFAALSRLQGDHTRLKRYFLKGYALALTLTIPLALSCAVFADDIIRTLLGQKWNDAVIIFRLLSPTILVFAVLKPIVDSQVNHLHVCLLYKKNLRLHPTKTS